MVEELVVADTNFVIRLNAVTAHGFHGPVECALDKSKLGEGYVCIVHGQPIGVDVYTQLRLLYTHNIRWDG